MKNIKINKYFNLIELSISIIITFIILQSIFPYTSRLKQREKEFELKYNLRKIRESIDKFYIDHMNYAIHDRYPKDFDELINNHYIRNIPIDPITGKKNWITISSTDDKDNFIKLSSDKRNIYDVKSRSERIAIDGSKYENW